jgi:hypothetical protein
VKAKSILDSKLASLLMTEGEMEARMARHKSGGFPQWRAKLAEVCHTIGMDATGLALTEDLDPNELAWPRFVPVIRLLRHRGLTDICSWAKLKSSPDAKFTVKYQVELAGVQVERNDLVVTPMEVHRELQIQYQRQQIQGWPHAKIMGHLNDLCGLPVAWKGCKPFTGGYDEKKLKMAWIINITMLLGVIALLLWDILSFYGEIPFDQVVFTMFLGEGIGLLTALTVPLLVKGILAAIYELDQRKLRKDAAKAAQLELDERQDESATTDDDP